MKNVTNKILKYMHKMGLYSYFYLITNKESCRINLCFILSDCGECYIRIKNLVELICALSISERRELAVLIKNLVELICALSFLSFIF